MKKNKFLALLLTCAMTVTVLAGCGSKNTTTAPSEDTNKPAESATYKIALIQQHQPSAQFAPGGFQQLLGLFHIPFGVQRPQLRRQLIGGGVILPHPVAEQRIAHQPDEGGRYQIVADPHDEQEGEHDLPSDGRKGMFSPCR